MPSTQNHPDPIVLLNEFYYNDPTNLKIALELHSIIINKYPFLTLQLKYNIPCYHFNDHNTCFFIVKKNFEGKKFTSPQLFFGFMFGYKLFHSKLFLESKLSNVKYINLTKLKSNKYPLILDLIGNAIEI
jgi:hypothetical protein